MWDSRQGLREQVAAWTRQLVALRTRLADLANADPFNAQRLGDTRQRLLNVCSVREVDLNTFARELIESGTVTDHWTRFAAIARQCRALAADCLALEQSIHLRANKTALAVCAAADRLCEEFSKKIKSPRPHYAVISEAEHFGADASTIHLSYTRLDLWNLNRAVHEFGHLWAEESASGPGGAQTAFIAATGNHWEKALAKEFFADLVATFLTGPAYACSCLLLDFNPADRLKTETHPTPDERAHCILMALDLLARNSDEFTRQQMIVLAVELGKFWTAARSDGGAVGPISCAMELESAVDIAVKRLDREIPNAKCRSLSRANAVVNSLGNAGERPAQAGNVDILNGAWLRRLDEPGKAFMIGNTALAMLINP
jgi:hypothetical protein